MRLKYGNPSEAERVHKIKAKKLDEYKKGRDFKLNCTKNMSHMKHSSKIFDLINRIEVQDKKAVEEDGVDLVTMYMLHRYINLWADKMETNYFWQLSKRERQREAEAAERAAEISEQN